MSAGTHRADTAGGPHRTTLHLVQVRVVFAAIAALAVLVAGCADRGPTSAVSDGADVERPGLSVPSFPDGEAASRGLLVGGIVYDLTHRPDDASFWSVPTAEATCAAESIVDDLGERRLNELGYRPGAAGSSLNDIGLSDDERGRVVDAVEGCVDMAEAVAAMFFGDGRIRSNVATCLADGLDQRGQLRPFVVAISFGRAVDPFADDSALASALLDQSVICVPEGAFRWDGLTLPGGATVLNADAPSGTPGSPYLADQLPSTTAPSTTTP